MQYVNRVTGNRATAKVMAELRAMRFGDASIDVMVTSKSSLGLMCLLLGSPDANLRASFSIFMSMLGYHSETLTIAWAR